MNYIVKKMNAINIRIIVEIAKIQFSLINRLSWLIGLHV